MEQDLDLTPDPGHFRLNACLKKVLGKHLTAEEAEAVRDVNRRQGWDKKALR